MPPCSQDERWKTLEDHCTERLDEVDFLIAEADQEILRVLENHVLKNEQFYEDWIGKIRSGDVDASAIPHGGDGASALTTHYRHDFEFRWRACNAIPSPLAGEGGRAERSESEVG
ncbi:hypothetical protein [Oryzicola mucosus]|uniref:Uncharacterized protein n=1 Tax=Oryzicola mucosus TaxID=2767425 RepID=A0A8J6Q4R4_9HYPH|nr:hypothetical protein [Oryzicola mucosus]MBD0416255.1 hypothetical protein [Oryzicola mucosus]